ncbi:MAG: type IV pilus secretin PilQ [Bacteriovoracaceae bacterium]
MKSRNLSILLLCILISFKAFSSEIKAVNFFQEGDVSKFVIDLDNENPEVTRFHVKEDKQIIIDVKNASASAKVLRGLDTSEFSGAIVYMTVYKKPGSANDLRFAIQLRDNVRSILDVAKNKVLLSVENRFGVFSQQKIESTEKNIDELKSTVATSGNRINIPKSENLSDILENLTLSGPKKYIGKNISINVQDLAIVDLLKMIADTSGFNIIIDKDISTAPPLTLSLTNIPWDQALDTVLQLSKLVARRNSNILMVTTLDKATNEKKAELESEKLTREQEPLVTKIFPLSFATTTDMRTIIEPYITPVRGRLALDERTNSLILRDTVDVIEKVRKVIETLDTQTPQILIEAKIVEANETFQKSIGLRSGISFGYDPITPIPAVGTGPGFSFSTAPNTTGSTFLGLTVGVFRRVRNLNFTLNMMEFESKGKIISSPKVITQNKKAATITSTDTTAYTQSTISNGVVTQSFASASANLNLNVTPQVTNDGSIGLQVAISKTGFLGRIADNAPPDTLTNRIDTNVLVENGSTMVLGGMYKTQESESHSGLPFFKDIPLIGWLFRTPYNPSQTKTELIIFLTPRIINQEEAGLVDRNTSAKL